MSIDDILVSDDYLIVIEIPAEEKKKPPKIPISIAEIIQESLIELDEVENCSE